MYVHLQYLQHSVSQSSQLGISALACHAHVSKELTAAKRAVCQRANKGRMGGAIWSCTCDVTPSTRASYDVHYSKLTLLSAQGTMAEPDLQGVVLNQEYRVKLGKSFTFPKENAFHTIKCEGDVGQCSHVLYLMPTRRLFSAGFHLYLSFYPSCFPLPPSLPPSSCSLSLPPSCSLSLPPSLSPSWTFLYR